MNENAYNEKIRKVGNTLIQSYIDNNRVETGINGPYDDPETEVRNLAHLIVISTIELEKYNRSELIPHIINMSNRLLTMKNENGTYCIRQKNGKDQSNGVIGHAWLVEGLIYAYKATEQIHFLREAERICRFHEFDKKNKLWLIPSKGTIRNIDYTFNHQLWYAASLAELLQYVRNEELKNQLDIYLSNLKKTLDVKNNGRISHIIYKRPSMLKSIKLSILRYKHSFDELLGRPNLRYREAGYHIFNLMAFARLYKLYPNIDLFRSSKFLKTLKYVSEKELSQMLISPKIEKDSTSNAEKYTTEEKSINIYGYPYNVPGFELLYCRKVWGTLLDTNSVDNILNQQFKNTWDDDTLMFGKRCHDKIDINYRVYEYYRYLELT